MSLTLYHYVHCPFCVRARMALGFLGVNYDSKVIPYNDEKTPIELTGKKMLPALKHDIGAMNESLDIIAFIDTNNLLKINETTSTPEFREFDAYLNFLGNPIHSLTMPYWIWTPEFDESSRKYFQKKKEEKRGPFKELVKNQKEFISKLENEWLKLDQKLGPYYQSENLGIYDILLASHLWGLYVVPEFQFPPKIHAYLQKVKQACNFNYHEDFWK